MSATASASVWHRGPAVPALHLLTDEAVLERTDFAPVAADLMDMGGARIAFHLRGPRTGGRVLFEHARALLASARAADVLLVVNDRVDVALAVGATGVHLGRRSIPVVDARALLGFSARVGVSTHTDEEAAEASAEGADWIFAGTIWVSSTHPDREGRGVGAITSAVAAVDATDGTAPVPVVAIGGVTPDRVATARKAGARGVAVIRGVWDAPDPGAALSRYLQALESDE